LVAAVSQQGYRHDAILEFDVYKHLLVTLFGWASASAQNDEGILDHFVFWAEIPAGALQVFDILALDRERTT